KTCLMPLWQQSVTLCSAASGDQELKCELQNGLPTILVPLPSKLETCQFTLKPVTETVGDFLTHVMSEDGGVERVALYSEDDIIIARSTSIDVLMRKPFKLRINDNRYMVHPPDLALLTCHAQSGLGTMFSTCSNWSLCPLTTAYLSGD
ncbi:putative calcium uniporter protein, mitochondrial, partial [Apostichopus japonicus]